MKIFCISIFNKDFEKLKNLNLIPVGLGKQKFNGNWLKDKAKKNISKKNINFGEYTFHYKLWKNKSLITNYDNWIGFCTYRRFWTKSKKLKISSYKKLNKIIIKKPLKEWKKFDVILGKPLIFKKVKAIKLIKQNIVEILKKPSVLYKDLTLEDQFRIFHGSFFLDKAIELMPNKYKEDFKIYLRGHIFYPYNMFICRNYKLLSKFYNEIFPWLLKCETAFKFKKLDGYSKVRIYGFLAERFMPFWFIKNSKIKTCNISFFEKKNR